MTQELDDHAATSHRDPRPAAIVAAVIIGYGIVSTVINFFTSYAMTGVPEEFPYLGDIGPMVQVYGSELLWTTVPLAVGAFFSLWLVLPITAQLGIGRVILSAVVATAIGIVLVLLATVVQTMSYFGPMMDPTSGGGVRQLADMLLNGITTVTFRVSWNEFAVVAAGCLGVWGWQLSRELRRLRAAS